jgi:pimeloyl-ACP methyl ester carboxylesterase
MENPFVHVVTADKLDLYGILINAPKKDTIIINIHGTADNFYDNDFVWQIAETLKLLNISVLSVNNRGSYNLEFYNYGPDARRNSGASVEIFEKCILDIDAWIKFALSLGYKKVILEGHSLGTEKVVYYMNKGKYRNKVKAVILLGFSDSYGHHFQQFNKKTRESLLNEAKTLIKNKKNEQFLTNIWLSHAGVLPQSAESYLNFFSDESELSKVFPIRNGSNLAMYKKIKVPILGVIGDQKEYTVIPVKDAIILLKTENKMAKIYQIKSSDHNFSGQEIKLASIIKKFIKSY